MELGVRDNQQILVKIRHEFVALDLPYSLSRLGTDHHDFAISDTSNIEAAMMPL